HLIILSMIRPPPTPTLFPYTTLFRSHDGKIRNHLGPRGLIVCAHPVEDPQHQAHRECRATGDDLILRQCRDKNADGQQAPALQQDRKSTRLNSSHVSISYAVFCLKKK